MPVRPGHLATVRVSVQPDAAPSVTLFADPDFGMAHALPRSHSTMHGEPTMATTAQSFNPLFMRHDLMIELGRVEMVLDVLRLQADQDDQVRHIPELEARKQRLSDALTRLQA